MDDGLESYEMNRYEQGLLRFFREGDPKRAPAWRRTRYEFVLEYGWWYKPMALPEGVDVAVANECFSNAFGLVLENDGLVHVEGLVIQEKGGIPVHHAWVTDGTGRAIDNTFDEPAAAYAGVPFRTAFVSRYCLEHDGAIWLLDDWMHDWPMLYELGDRPEEWLEERGRGVAKLTWS